MNQDSAAFAYQQSNARGASPLGQVVALYDTILRDFHRALAAIEAGQVETRVFELNHALTVIGALQSALDFERGGDAAKVLERFYNVTRPMILGANVRASREAILNLVDLYQGVRRAWQQAERNLAAGAMQAAENSAVSKSAPANRVIAKPEPADEPAPSRWCA